MQQPVITGCISNDESQDNRETHCAVKPSLGRRSSHGIIINGALL